MSNSAERDFTPFSATIEEYLAFEGAAEFKHEWRDGEVIAMAGGTSDHALIIANLIRAIGNRLQGKGCRVFASEQRVRSRRPHLYTYPDVTVVCGEREFDPADENRVTILNPTLLVEVLSESNELYDRSEKFERYRGIESLREYVLVSQYIAKIETFHRADDGTWVINHAVAGVDATVRFASVDVELPLAEIYDGIQFRAPPAAPS